ncbi:MAG: TRAP transporter small permease subunit [Chloroflexi bacterium]|nr:TRAP transporter small permease subunit [Chloroflexota bacterium]
MWSYMVMAAQWLLRATSALAVGANAVATVSIFVILVVVMTDLAGRNMFNLPVPGALEVASALMALVVMLGLAYAEQTQAHIRIEILAQRLPPAGQAALDVLAYCLGILFSGLIMVETWSVAVRSLVRWETLPGVLSLPIFPAYFMVPIGSALLLLQFLTGLGRSLRALLAPKRITRASQ